MLNAARHRMTACEAIAILRRRHHDYISNWAMTCSLGASGTRGPEMTPLTRTLSNFEVIAIAEKYERDAE